MGGVRKTVDTAVLAEQSGFQAFWYCEDLFKRDCWVILTAAASATEKMGLGTAIVNPYTSHVVEVAMRASTLQEYCGGRFRLGIGVGAPETLRWAGLEISKPVEGLIDAVRNLRKLFSGHPLNPQSPSLLRFPQNPPPIYIGGQGPRLCRLMGVLGDGGLPLIVPPEAAAKSISWIKAGAGKASRKLEDIDVSACVWYFVAEDREEMESSIELKRLIAYYGPMLADDILRAVGLSREDFRELSHYLEKNEEEKALEHVTEKMFRLAITGTYNQPEVLIRRFRELKACGVNHFNIGPPLGLDIAKVVEFTGKIMPRVG